MIKYRTLVIFDWDDTLFPTTWATQKMLNLTNTILSPNTILMFHKLDTLLYELLTKIMKHGRIIIVTNAASKWIIASSRVLPNTQKLLRHNLLIVSAREAYGDQCDIDEWKTKVFNEIVTEFDAHSVYQNIISVGDADYEFDALKNLYNKKCENNQRFLKNIKLKRYPQMNELYDQLTLLNNNIEQIIKTNNHMDLKFDPT